MEGKTEDGSTVDLTGSTSLKYQSSDAYILTVNPDGEIVIGDENASGFAIVTVTYTNEDTTTVQGKIIITVAKDQFYYDGFENLPEPPTTGSYKFYDETVARPDIKLNNTHYQANKTLFRTGTQAGDIQVAQHSWPPQSYANYKEEDPTTWPSTVMQYGLDLSQTISDPAQLRPSYIGQGWFYDSGKTQNAKATVYFQASEQGVGQCLNVFIGVYDDSKSYYTFKNREMKRSEVQAGGTKDPNNQGYLGDLITHDNGVEMNGQPQAVKGGTKENPYEGTYTFPAMPRSEGWHQVVAVLDGGEASNSNVATENGTISYYLDGTLIAVEHYVPNTIQTVRGSAYYAVNSGTYSTYDDFSLMRYYKSEHPPMIKDLTVSGKLIVGQQLTASCQAESLNGAELADTTYQWYRSSDKKDWIPIAGAVNPSFTLTENEENNYIRVGVTAHAKTAPTDGVETYSDILGPVAAQELPPQAISPAITGTPAVGSVLTLEYEYDGVSPQGNSIFLWEAERTAGTWETVGTAKSYRVAIQDAGKQIRASVTPVDINQTEGSKATAPAVTISADVPTIEFFVAPDGNDVTGNGTLEQPYATFQKAQEEVAKAKSSASQITVYFRGGEYPLENSISLTPADSGTEQVPIIYKAYNNETVVFTGKKKLDATKITKVTDETLLNRLADPVAKKKLYQLDLKEAGLTSLQPLSDYYGWWGTRFLPDDFFFNNASLEMARYPNNEHNYAYLYTKEVTAPENSDGPNGWRESPFTIVYEDALDRAKLWDLEGKDDLYISGVYGQDFAFMTNRVDTSKFDPDKKEFISVVGSKTGYRVQADHRFFFMNIFEEIDFPGEYYIDRENMILYFYPPDDLEDVTSADLETTVLNSPMLELNGVEYVTFEGLTFDKTRNVAVTASGLNNVTFDGCTISRTGLEGMNLSGKNITVTNCHLYDLGAGGLFLSGDATDRKNLVSNNNKIINNRIHDVNRLSGSGNDYVPGLRVSDSNGVVIEHNELYNSKMMHVWFQRSNDIDFRYNHFYNAALDGGDMGALYWGRDISTMGIRIQYNYFHDVGNTYKGGDWNNLGVQSIFWDDNTIGPELIGNIFYRGGCGQGFTVKTNNGQWSKAENNILVESKVGFQYQMRSGGAPGTKQKNWYEAVLTDPNIIPTYTTNVDITSPVWVNHYQDTIWAPVANFKEAFAPDGPADTNTNQKNLFVNISNPFNGGENSPGCIQQNNWATDTDPGFVEYGKDFQLTAAGLAEVQKHIPGFENIPTELIGVQPYQKDGKTLYVGGQAPAAADVKIIDAGSNMLGVTYTYSDPDGDKESNSQIKWYVSDQQDGDYTLLPGKRTNLFLEASLANKWVKAEVVPFDSYRQQGESVFSAPVQIDNVRPDPSQALNEAMELLQNTNVGTALGEVPAEIKQKLQEEADATELAASNPDTTSNQLQQAIDNLTKAIEAFKNAVVTKLTVTENNQTISIPASLDSVTIMIEQDVTGTTAQFDVSKPQPETIIQGWLPIDGIRRKTTLQIQKGTKFTGAEWNGQLSLFTASQTASASVPSGQNINAVVLAGGAPLTASKTVRIEVEGEADRNIGWVSDKQFHIARTILSQDTFEQADQTITDSKLLGKVNTSPNLVMYTATLEELVIYRQVLISPTPSPTPDQPWNNGTGNNGSNTGGTVTSYPGNSSITSNINSPGNNQTPEKTGFTDIAGHWAQADIEVMYQRNIVSGLTPAIFAPDRQITRAEFAALITRTLSLQSGKDDAGFADVTADEWFSQSVNAAAAAGLIVGSDGMFRPMDSITREEMAVIIVKAYYYMGKVSANGGIDKFSDRDQISQWAQKSVDVAASTGLISGITTDIFDPQGSATRAQATAILRRLLDHQ